MLAIYILGCAIVLGVILVVYWASVTLSAYDGRPKLRPDDIVYCENFASVCCALNVWTRMVWAVKWARLIVTDDTLVITSWFPFVLLSALWDIEHVTKVAEIESFCLVSTFPGYLRLVYTDRKGRQRVVGIVPVDQAAFRRALEAAKLRH